MTAYGEFRQPYNKDSLDHRLIFYGIRYITETYLARKWTIPDLLLAEAFFKEHNIGYTPYPFPRDLFVKFITENNGYFPVTIHALPEGTVIHPHVPVYQITAKEEYSSLVTYLETLLSMVWVNKKVYTRRNLIHGLVPFDSRDVI